MIIANGYFNAREQSFVKFLDFYNEIKLILIVYHLMLFTMFVPKPETRHSLGYSCFTVMAFSLFVNISSAIITSLKSST